MKVEKKITKRSGPLSEEDFARFLEVPGELGEPGGVDGELRLVAEKAKVGLGKDDVHTWEFLMQYFEKHQLLYPALCCAEVLLSKDFKQELGKKQPGIEHRYVEIQAAYAKRKQEEIDALQQLPVGDAGVIQQEQAPIISVIMPTYNRAEKIRESIESVMAQTFRDFQLIIVNDGGSKNCEKVIQAFNTSKIQYLYVPHGGLSAALNHGIKAARSKYIAYLDDDDRYYPNHLATLVKHLETSEYPLVYSDGCRIEMEIRDKAKHPQPLEISRKVYYSRDFDPGVLCHHNYIPICCIAHRKDCFQRTGLFETALPNVMDWDMWVKFSRFFDFKHIKKTTCEYELRRYSGPGGSLSGNRLVHRFYTIMLRHHHEYQADIAWQEVKQQLTKKQIDYFRAEKIVTRYFSDPLQCFTRLLPPAVAENRWDAVAGLIKKLTLTAPKEKIWTAARLIFTQTPLRVILFSIPLLISGCFRRIMRRFK